MKGFKHEISSDFSLDFLVLIAIVSSRKGLLALTYNRHLQGVTQLEMNFDGALGIKK